LLLDKGIVINADIAVSIGDAELLGIQLRAAIASFETAARYGLEFPTGTDTDRIEEIAEATGVDDEDDREIDRSEVGERMMGLHEPPVSENSPAMESAPITEPDEESEGTSENAGEEDDDGLTETVEGAGEVLSGDDDTYSSGSEPGVRERPTAPDVSEADDGSDENADEGGSDADTDRDAGADADGDADTEDEPDGNDDMTGDDG
jgi:hypothetical protein